MATVDLTKNAVTIIGDHSFFAYALDKAREDYKALYEEVDEFDPQIEYSQYSPDAAYFFAFSRRLFRSETHIILISASLVEALANMFYSERADSEMLAIIERATPVEKWVTLPKMYIPSYSLPKSEKLYQTLKQLISRRNNVVHSKPQMLKGKTIMHKGNLIKRTKDEYKLHMEFCDLPAALISNLKTYDQIAGSKIEIMFSMGSEQRQNSLFK